jgi:hypothetical protein
MMSPKSRPALHSAPGDFTKTVAMARANDRKGERTVVIKASGGWKIEFYFRIAIWFIYEKFCEMN